MKASIIYNSENGATKAYAEEIGKTLSAKGIDNKIESIYNYDKKYLQLADIVLLGTWTKGLFIIGQHPDTVWQEFASKLPKFENKKIGLFTTYKIATGSMFRKMKSEL